MRLEELLQYTVCDVLKDRPANDILQDDGALLKTNSVIIQLNVAKDRFLEETHALTEHRKFSLSATKESYRLIDVLEIYSMGLWRLDVDYNLYKFLDSITPLNDRQIRNAEHTGVPRYYRSQRRNSKLTIVDFFPIPDDSYEYQVQYSCAVYISDFPMISKTDSPDIIESKLNTEVELDTGQALLLAQHVLFESATNRDLEQFSDADRNNALSKWREGINYYKHEKYNQIHSHNTGVSNPWR